MGDELALGGAQTGTDIDGQIRAGVEAFMQSQDPAIAVEVVTMLASMLGVAPQIDPYADPGLAADPYTQQVPAASNGMRFYKKGGKFVVKKKSSRKYAIGGKVDPNKPKQPARTIDNPGYTPLNPRTTPAMNRMHAQNNLNTALRLRNALTGTNRNVIPANTNIIGNNAPVRFGSGVDANGVGMNYTLVPPQVQSQADSVINASRQYLYPNRRFENGGKIDGPPDLGI